MQQLLEIIIGFFEDETRKVESGVLKEEDQLFDLYVQEIDPNFPNILLDHYLKDLNAGELKILLIIIRQTYGWLDTSTGKRKTLDRISHSQLRRSLAYAPRLSLEPFRASH